MLFGPLQEALGRLLRVVIPDDDFAIIGTRRQGTRGREGQGENIICVDLSETHNQYYVFTEMIHC